MSLPDRARPFTLIFWTYTLALRAVPTPGPGLLGEAALIPVQPAIEPLEEAPRLTGLVGVSRIWLTAWEGEADVEAIACMV